MKNIIMTPLFGGLFSLRRSVRNVIFGVIFINFRGRVIAFKRSYYVRQHSEFELLRLVFLVKIFIGGGGLKNQLKKIVLDVDAAHMVSDNSDSEMNIKVSMASSLYVDFILSYFNGQVCLDTDGWHCTSKLFGERIQSRVRPYESFGENIGSRP